MLGSKDLIEEYMEDGFSREDAVIAAKKIIAKRKEATMENRRKYFQSRQDRKYRK